MRSTPHKRAGILRAIFHVRELGHLMLRGGDSQGLVGAIRASWSNEYECGYGRCQK